VNVEGKLDAARVARWTGALKPTLVEVFVPRFTFDWGGSVKETLKDIGIHRAFDDVQADFSGIGGEPGDLYVSDVFHKTFVKVDEEGTEAAAATAVTIVLQGSEIHALGAHPIFRADHPFVFFVRDQARGRMLFVGRLAEPKT
jgi:serpin B